MAVYRKAREAGIVQPADLELLGRVFDATSSPEESERDREARASRILAYFMAGINDEGELKTLARQPLGR